MKASCSPANGPGQSHLVGTVSEGWVVHQVGPQTLVMSQSLRASITPAAEVLTV